MNHLENWTLPELILDLQESGDLIPVVVMEEILERGASALDPLLDLVEEINRDPGIPIQPMWPLILLGELRRSEAVPALIDAIWWSADTDNGATMAASEALLKIGTQAAVQAVHTLVRHGTPPQRLWGYALAGWIRDPRMYALLENALNDDPEMRDVVASALIDQRDARAIEPLYRALQLCAPWQHADVIDAIQFLHAGEVRERLFEKDWRLRYRLNPRYQLPDFTWPVVSGVLRNDAGYRERPAPPLQPLEELLAQTPAPRTAHRCDCCNVETWVGTGIVVCPKTATTVAGMQLDMLIERRDREGVNDLFDFLDLIDLELDDLQRTELPPSRRAREEREDQHDALMFQRGACIWAVEHGARTVGQARPLLWEEALRLEQQYGDPNGVIETLSQPVVAAPAPERPVAGRNDPCPCGSGRKYKKCCGAAGAEPGPAPLKPVNFDHEAIVLREHTAPPGRREPEAAELLQQVLARHYDEWPDQPLPALQGRTARSAAQDPATREAVITLLQEMENFEWTKPAAERYDFGSIWTELGLERWR